MGHWNRQAVRDMLSDLESNDGCKIVDTTPGGDWDLPGLSVRPPNTDNWITITPFLDPISTVLNDVLSDDCKIYAIELRTNGDSRGGLQSDEEHVCVIFGRIMARLSKAGHSIIGHYHEIF